MQIRVFNDAHAIGQATAALVASRLLLRPDSVLGLATGSSPVPAYRELIRLHQSGALDFSRARSFNLDEYAGIPEDHPCSYHRFMQEQLFDHINIPAHAHHVPDGNAADLDAAAAAYDAAIREAGGIDIQLLGIGRNGHIGFNEPDDHFTGGCHTVTLAQSTIEANKRFFRSIDEVPRQAISLGIGAIMAARRVILIATGTEKAAAIRATVEGDITPSVPASILQAHPDCILLLDQAAASLLSKPLA